MADAPRREPPEWGTDEHLRWELDHLLHGPQANAVHVGVGPLPIYFRAARPQDVIERVRAVMVVAVRAMLEGWVPGEPKSFVPEGIPHWFRQACATPTESTEDRWALDEWLFWCDPDERQWFWWDACTTGPDTGEVLIETTGVPFPTVALRWSLRACGAENVTC
ncbi:MAG: hypothetical protein KC668_23890 [Myxococcales bacterium]|nr:hypothetical protein [Myxococcales bacterium]